MQGLPTRSSNGTISAALEDHIERADRTRHLNGFTYRNDAAARKRAAELDADPDACPGGLLRGWVGVIKDSIHVKDAPNSAGTPLLRNFLPQKNAPVVTALLDQGAIVLGKANMHELALGTTSNNPTFGPVRNPHGDDHSSGGSSGGTATVVASGAARFGLGTDTGGSVRIPAALTGLYGLRPTTGRYPGYGVTPLCSSRDTVGVMTRTMADLDLVDQAISGAPANTPWPVESDLRLAAPSARYTDELDPEVRRVWLDSLQALQDEGITVAELDTCIPDALDDEWGMDIVFAEAYSELQKYLSEFVPTLTLDELLAGIAMPEVAAAFAANRPASEKARELMELQARSAKRAAASEYSKAFSATGTSALIFPTTPVPAPRLGVDDENVLVDGKLRPSFNTLTRNMKPGSFAGLPGITLPAGVSSVGLPVGLSLDGPAGSDRRLIAIAGFIDGVLAKAASSSRTV
jgi:Asp-tRNA(Asn)/Glu-tRNA(Gln) amidotransferase A subunit family amidase